MSITVHELPDRYDVVLCCRRHKNALPAGDQLAADPEDATCGKTPDQEGDDRGRDT